MSTQSVLDQASLLLDAGRLQDAARLATQVLTARPRSVQAHRILGLYHRQNGDLLAAEASFRTALKLDRADESSALDLAGLLAETDRSPAAETVLRMALAARRRSPALAIGLARLLTDNGKAEEALRLLSSLPPENAREHAVLAAQAAALKARGQPEAALEKQRLAARLYPESPVAHHNLAATLGDLGHFAQAARSSHAALARGGTAPQTWLVCARALMGAGRLDEAEAAFRETIRRDPGGLDGIRGLAQLIWMRREDKAAAMLVVDTAIAAQPNNPALLLLRATVLQNVGDPAGAAASLEHATARHPRMPALHIAAAELAGAQGHAQAALEHAQRAASLTSQDRSPDYRAAHTALCAACLALGDAQRAADIAEALVHSNPMDQRALAYQATAWRLLNDPRYPELYDYAAFVRAWRMDTPEGWPDLPAYLQDLTEALGGLHPFRTHPLEQSVRHGSQATHLRASDNPTIQAFFQAVDAPIRRHLAELGAGPDPLRARNTGRHRFHGAWSVRLRPSGFHVDHIHPEGWLSSACYIALPETGVTTREAWIKFGEPGIPTSPALVAEHYVQPEPGLLVLFPSYMWHGTVPFSSGGARLSVAFDLVPE